MSCFICKNIKVLVQLIKINAVLYIMLHIISFFYCRINSFFFSSNTAFTAVFMKSLCLNICIIKCCIFCDCLYAHTFLRISAISCGAAPINPWTITFLISRKHSAGAWFDFPSNIEAILKPLTSRSPLLTKYKIRLIRTTFY